MIVDVHAHIWAEGTLPAGFWEGWVRMGVALGGSPERVKSRLSELWDPAADQLLRDMDQAGIDKAVFMCLNEAEVNLAVEAGRAHPGRLVAFMGLDPRREGATELLEGAVREWGIKGLKLHPPAYEFYPNDNMVYPLYQKALELGIPVAIHTGAETPPWRSKFGHPVFLDDVAVDFPQLTLIVAHAGLMWWWDAISLAAYKPNIYLEVSGWQPRLRRNPLEFYAALRTMLDLVGPGRVMFGSDWPALKFSVSQDRWVKAFKQVPELVQAAGIRFTEKEINGILGDTAARLLGL